MIWKEQTAWLKGGLIGFVFGFIYVALFFASAYFDFDLIRTLTFPVFYIAVILFGMGFSPGILGEKYGLWVSESEPRYMILSLIFCILFFILGAVIGHIVSIIKTKK